MTTISPSRRSSILLSLAIGALLAFVSSLIALVALPAQSAAALPASGSWSAAAPLEELREFPAIAPLPNGDAIILGGKDPSGTAEATTEIYELSSGTWVPGREMAVGRAFPASATLADGKVLVAGGFTGNISSPSGKYLASAETYDPSSREWTAIASMQVGREGAAAARLPDGDVLVAGGEDEAGEYLSSVEAYDPAADTWTTLAPMLEPREREIAVALSDGDILLAGGENESGPLSSAEIYLPSANEWRPVAAMGQAREGAAAAPLGNGDVLVAGGFNEEGGSHILSTSEIYDPASDSWSPGATMIEGREGGAAAPLGNGEVLVAGGGLTSSELFASAPAAAVSGGDFGDEAVGEASASSEVIVTNLGGERLSISGATLLGVDARDFAIVTDGCEGRSLAFGESCSISALFKPLSAGALTASIELSDNEPAAATVTLTGKGVVAPASVIGREGKQGATGKEGPRGKAGPLEVVTCKRVRRSKRKHAKTIELCRVRRGVSTMKAAGKSKLLTVVLRRGGKRYAKGFALMSGRRSVSLLLRLDEKTPKGRYVLMVRRNGKRERLRVRLVGSA